MKELKNTDLAREKDDFESPKSHFEVTLGFCFPSLVVPAHVPNLLYLVDVVELGVEEEWSERVSEVSLPSLCNAASSYSHVMFLNPDSNFHWKKFSFKRQYLDSDILGYSGSVDQGCGPS